MKILILFAHPRFSASIAQRKFMSAIQGIADLTMHDLYATYPDMMIDREREQALLLEHDLIIFQHPFYWYSSPAIIKEWQDIVLDYGWAYGPGGNKLHGKFMMSAISAGGAHDAYRPGGRNRYSVEELLAPFNQTAYLCGMAWLTPFVTHESRRISATELESQAMQWRELIEGLATGKLDPLARIAQTYDLPATFKSPQKA
jgi:glutathione-regulated potassium-efflux system ancillary protein KefG